MVSVGETLSGVAATAGVPADASWRQLTHRLREELAARGLAWPPSVRLAVRLLERQISYSSGTEDDRRAHALLVLIATRAPEYGRDMVFSARRPSGRALRPRARQSPNSGSQDSLALLYPAIGIADVGALEQGITVVPTPQGGAAVHCLCGQALAVRIAVAQLPRLRVYLRPFPRMDSFPDHGFCPQCQKMRRLTDATLAKGLGYPTVDAWVTAERGEFLGFVMEHQVKFPRWRGLASEGLVAVPAVEGGVQATEPGLVLWALYVRQHVIVRAHTNR